MTTTLLSLLGALLFTFACAQVTPQQDFDLQAIAGKWFVVGFATDAHWFVSRKSEMTMGTDTLTPTPEGDLHMSFASLHSDGTCFRMTHTAKKTDTPGKFTFRSQRWGNDNEVIMVEVKDDFALIHTIKTKAGVSEVLNRMYARAPKLSPGLQRKFRQFSLETGVKPENIVFFPKNDECPPA